MEKDNRRLILGIIFVVVGTIVLLDNLDVFEFRIPEYILRWESILILVGVINLFSKNFPAAFTLIGLGAFFWVLRDNRINFFDLWPVVLIIFGLGFILKHTLIHSGRKKLSGDQSKN